MSDDAVTTPDSGDRVVGAERVLAVLVDLAEHPEGVSLDEVSRRLNSSRSTVHRALTSLRRMKLANQVGRGLYVLGDEFYRLAFQSYSARPDGAQIRPILEHLAETYGETVHYAVLDGPEVVYRAKVDPPRGAVRLTSIVGGRNPAYRTAVGKLLLSRKVTNEASLRALIGNGPLVAKTPRTITSVEALWEELQRTRARGFAIDDQENEDGVNCVAVPVTLQDGFTSHGAISVSALAFRTPLARLVAEVPAIVRAVAEPRGGTQ